MTDPRSTAWKTTSEPRGAGPARPESDFPDTRFRRAVSIAGRKKARRKEIAAAQPCIEELPRLPDVVVLCSSADLVAHASAIAIEIDHSVYDCLDLAYAEVEGAPLVTADGKLRNAAQAYPAVDVWHIAAPDVRKRIATAATALVIEETTVQELITAYAAFSATADIVIGHVPRSSRDFRILTSEDQDTYFDTPAYRRLVKLIARLSSDERIDLMVLARNPNTRLAYLAAVRRFAEWCECRGLALDQVEPMVVAAYIEQLSGALAPASVKQHLAALRLLFDWLVVGQILPFNPASSVRGPRHVVKTGKTPVLSAKETRALLDGIDVSTLTGLRDRAFLGVLVYSFARVSAAVSLRVADYYTQGPRSFFRLHEKGGRYNVVPAHHTAQAYVDAYLTAAGIGEDRRGPLFRSCEPGRRDALQDRAMSRLSALKMIKRRARKAGLPAKICAHSFRGTGITEYLRNGGDLEVAARIAGHESTRTTQLYNRLNEEISLAEIERIHI